MTHRHYPRYNDDADFTTNAPSYYDDLARKQKLIELLSKRIWEYDEELAKRFDEWDTNLEDFPEDVKILLQQWLDDGTLDHIINDTIFNWKLDTTIFEQFRDSTTTQLQQNAMNIDQRGVSVLDFKEHAITNGDSDPNKWDWTTAIDLAIAYATSNKTAIYFPAGTFTYKGNLIIEDNSIQLIKGAGTSKTKILFDTLSGVAITTISYYTRNINIEDMTIALKDNTYNVSGIKAITPPPYAWGAGLNMRNVNMENFTLNTLELVEGFNAYFENCLFRGVITETNRKGTLLKLSRKDSFGNVINFNSCVFHYGKIGVMNTGASPVGLTQCTFESLDLFLNVVQIPNLTTRMIFEQCWFENLRKGIINSRLNEETLLPITPIQEYTSIKNIQFSDNVGSIGLPTPALNDTLEPYYVDNFNFSYGAIDNFNTIPTKDTVILNTGGSSTDDTPKITSHYINTGSTKLGFFFIHLEVSGFEGNKMNATLYGSNKGRNIGIIGDIRDSGSIGSDYKIKASWPDQTQVAVTVYAKGVTKVTANMVFIPE